MLYVFKFPLLMTGIAILVTFTWPIGMFPEYLTACLMLTV